MAKALPKAPGTSRVRFIMVEAEMADSGDLSQITQAIQNALRPAPTSMRLGGSAHPRANGAAANGGGVASQVVEVNGEEIEEQDDADTAEEEAPASSAPRPPRKIRTPKVLDVDLTTAPSFAEYAADRNPPSHMMRYLTVAAWFKLHRSTDAITADHVYTCYRAVKWPSDIGDFSQALRDLKGRQHVNSAGRGLYAINHLGLQEVENLGKS